MAHFMAVLCPPFGVLRSGFSYINLSFSDVVVFVHAPLERTSLNTEDLSSPRSAMKSPEDEHLSKSIMLVIVGNSS